MSGDEKGKIRSTLSKPGKKESDFAMNDPRSSVKTIPRMDGCVTVQPAESEIGLKSGSNSEELDTDSSEAPQIATTEAPEGRSPRKQLSILVVDDEFPIRSLIGSALERWGFWVHLASSGNEAQEILAHEAFDLILTDVIMEDGDGLTLLDWVHARHPDIPVVMVTAASDIGTAIESMHRGACDYILKPFNHEKLFETIQHVLEQRRDILEARAFQNNLEQELHTRTDMLRWAVDDLQRSHNLMLLTLGDALDLRDSETEGHSKRVTAYCIALARALKMPPFEIKVLAQGALLHDVGKIAIPDAILRKPGKLSMEEQEIMRKHCEHAYEMLCRIPFLAEASEIVLSHHERFDGSGYPGGLRGSEIPLGARVFAVADTLDAITSDRPYRKARTFAAAREEILSGSGTDFDPEVVEAFSKISLDLWLKLCEETKGELGGFSLLREVSSYLPDFSGLKRLMTTKDLDRECRPRRSTRLCDLPKRPNSFGREGIPR